MSLRIGPALAALVASLAGGFGCGGSTHRAGACGALGCNSGVIVNIEQLRSGLPGAQSVELCLDHRCIYGQARLDVIRDIVPTVAPSKRSHEVSLIVRDAHHKTTLRIQRTITLLETAPNGVACGPVCFGRVLTLNARARQLEAP